MLGNWIIWIVGLLVMGYVAWKWVIPFIKAHPVKSFSLPVGRKTTPTPKPEPEQPAPNGSRIPNKRLEQ